MLIPRRLRAELPFVLLALAVAGVLGLLVSLALGCAHMQERNACRDQCSREHPGQKAKVVYSTPSDAYMACVTECDRK